MKALLLLHLLATLTMFGAILIVQVVHYPLFSGVGVERWAAYEAAHQTRITWVVGPAMLLELGTAVALVWMRPTGLPLWMLWSGLVLVGVIWASTAFVQVPLHNTLMVGFDGDAHARLVGTNWIRTVAWTLRTVLVLWMTALLLDVG